MTDAFSRDEESSLEARLALVQRMLAQAATELADVLSEIGNNDDPETHGGQDG